MKKKLKCPQCDIHRFAVRNEAGESVVVVVMDDLTIVPIDETKSLDGFDLETLFCLGCSWSGSVNAIAKYSKAKR
jgi:hypothetical protein